MNSRLFLVIVLGAFCLTADASFSQTIPLELEQSITLPVGSTVWVVVASAQSSPETTLPSDSEPKMLSVNLSLDRSEYLEGEIISLVAHFSFDKSGGIGGDAFTVSNCLEVTDESGRKMMGGGLHISEPPRAATADFSTKCNLNSDFFSPETRAPSSFRHLLPGRYTCRYKCHNLTSVVSFQVSPVPDSLATLWLQYERISSVTYNNASLGLSKRAAADTVEVLLQQVMSYAPGQPYRKLCLRTGLFMYQLTRTWGKMIGLQSVWTSSDSLPCVQALMAYNQEPDREASFVITSALATLYDSLPSGAARTQALLNFARSTGDPAVISAAQKRIENEAREEAR